MTLDGLVRALRWKALDLAEQAERGTLSARQAPMERRNSARITEFRGKEDGDDRGRG
ncbi:hypothetical protein [Ollibium composti]|uniref:hypothetical protein n=1 Tax=Ollibium composti TaxID=2675109 RepID=UPI001454D2A8|nr:hypothetical protein [Mesorhizobium composti]